MPATFPAMVAGEVPAGAESSALHVSKLVESVVDGLKVVVTPGGS